MTMIRPLHNHAVSGPATPRGAVPAPHLAHLAGLRATTAAATRRGRTFRGPGAGTGTGSRNPRRRRGAS